MGGVGGGSEGHSRRREGGSGGATRRGHGEEVRRGGRWWDEVLGRDGSNSEGRESVDVRFGLNEGSHSLEAVVGVVGSLNDGCSCCVVLVPEALKRIARASSRVGASTPSSRPSSSSYSSNNRRRRPTPPCCPFPSRSRSCRNSIEVLSSFRIAPVRERERTRRSSTGCPGVVKGRRLGERKSRREERGESG